MAIKKTYLYLLLSSFSLYFFMHLHSAYAGFFIKNVNVSLSMNLPTKGLFATKVKGVEGVGEVSLIVNRDGVMTPIELGALNQVKSIKGVVRRNIELKGRLKLTDTLDFVDVKRVVSSEVADERLSTNYQCVISKGLKEILNGSKIEIRFNEFSQNIWIDGLRYGCRETGGPEGQADSSEASVSLQDSIDNSSFAPHRQRRGIAVTFHASMNIPQEGLIIKTNVSGVDKIGNIVLYYQRSGKQYSIPLGSLSEQAGKKSVVSFNKAVEGVLHLTDTIASIDVEYQIAGEKQKGQPREYSPRLYQCIIDRPLKRLLGSQDNIELAFDEFRDYFRWNGKKYKCRAVGSAQGQLDSSDVSSIDTSDEIRNAASSSTSIVRGVSSNSSQSTSKETKSKSNHFSSAHSSSSSGELNIALSSMTSSSSAKESTESGNDGWFDNKAETDSSSDSFMTSLKKASEDKQVKKKLKSRKETKRKQPKLFWDSSSSGDNFGKTAPKKKRRLGKRKSNGGGSSKPVNLFLDDSSSSSNDLFKPLNTKKSIKSSAKGGKKRKTSGSSSSREVKKPVKNKPSNLPPPLTTNMLPPPPPPLSRTNTQTSSNRGALLEQIRGGKKLKSKNESPTPPIINTPPPPSTTNMLPPPPPPLSRTNTQTSSNRGALLEQIREGKKLKSKNESPTPPSSPLLRTNTQTSSTPHNDFLEQIRQGKELKPVNKNDTRSNQQQEDDESTDDLRGIFLKSMKQQRGAVDGRSSDGSSSGSWSSVD